MRQQSQKKNSVTQLGELDIFNQYLKYFIKPMGK